MIIDPERLQRQFLQMTRIASAIPIYMLSYPRRLAALSEVRKAILAEAGPAGRRARRGKRGLRVQRVKRFLRLPPADRGLFLRALFWVGAVRMALFVAPFQWVWRVCARRPDHADHADRAPVAAAVNRVDRIVWAVRAAARCVPHATCLTQALACQALLSRSGYASRLEIGVAKDGDDAGRRFEAHAWVVCEGAWCWAARTSRVTLH